MKYVTFQFRDALLNCLQREILSVKCYVSTAYYTVFVCFFFLPKIVKIRNISSQNLFINKFVLFSLLKINRQDWILSQSK